MMYLALCAILRSLTNRPRLYGIKMIYWKATVIRDSVSEWVEIRGEMGIAPERKMSALLV